MGVVAGFLTFSIFHFLGYELLFSGCRDQQDCSQEKMQMEVCYMTKNISSGRRTAYRAGCHAFNKSRSLKTWVRYC